jgi:hypothetical protein
MKREVELGAVRIKRSIAILDVSIKSAGDTAGQTVWGGRTRRFWL